MRTEGNKLPPSACIARNPHVARGSRARRVAVGSPAGNSDRLWRHVPGVGARWGCGSDRCGTGQDSLMPPVTTRQCRDSWLPHIFHPQVEQGAGAKSGLQLDPRHRLVAERSVGPRAQRETHQVHIARRQLCPRCGNLPDGRRQRPKPESRLCRKQCSKQTTARHLVRTLRYPGPGERGVSNQDGCTPGRPATSGSTRPACPSF
jgi:hypothetical protein